MPIDYRDYPDNWLDEIRPSILERAGHACEWCQVANYAEHPDTGSKVILTIAHIDQDKTNNDPENLAALCQKCHLNHDREHHLETQRLNREARKEASMPHLPALMPEDLSNHIQEQEEKAARPLRGRVIMFQDRFVGVVQCGLKLQTVRPDTQHRPGVGTRLYLRHWAGKPYRSKHVQIKEAVCTDVYPITIEYEELDRSMLVDYSEACSQDVAEIASGMIINIQGTYMPPRNYHDCNFDGELTPKQCHQFAELDGFKDAFAMRQWFVANHNLLNQPFKGILITWA